jgi:hypothetical protein
VKFDTLPELDRTRDRLDVMLAAKLMGKIFPRNVRCWAKKLVSVTEVAGALRRTGNVKRDSSRPLMQKEAHADPW